MSLSASFVLFFCFKQKTAYEMRISDWSSDVCSSDLLDADHMRKLAGRKLSKLDLAQCNASGVDMFFDVEAECSSALIKGLGTFIKKIDGCTLADRKSVV